MSNENTSSDPRPSVSDENTGPEFTAEARSEWEQDNRKPQISLGLSYLERLQLTYLLESSIDEYESAAKASRQAQQVTIDNLHAGVAVPVLRSILRKVQA